MQREESLIRQAQQVMERAHAPYSRFSVGAAIESKDGRVFCGCNIESSSFGLTICAERVAIFKAISEGVRGFAAIAITSSSGTIVPPCGACRQVLWDLAGDISIIMAASEKDYQILPLSQLLPRAFNADFLLP